MGMGMGMGNNMLGFNQMLMNMNNFPEMESIKLLIQKDVSYFLRINQNIKINIIITVHQTINFFFAVSQLAS